MACRVGCPTQDHRSWGECAREAHLRIAYCQSAKGHDFSRQKKWDNDLDAYASAVRQGIEPESTTRRDVDFAVAASHDTGIGFGTDSWESTIEHRALEVAS